MDINIFHRFSSCSGNDQQYTHLWIEGAALLMEQYISLIQKISPTYKLEILPIENFINNNSDKIATIFAHHRSDKSTHHNYHHLYAYIFNQLNNDPNCNILEIGLGTNDPKLVSSMGINGRPGASLYAFSEFFDKANIYGADIDENILFNTNKIKTCKVDQMDIKTFVNLQHTFGKKQYDLIIDDGLHSIAANFNTLLFALDNIKVNGWIVIEDIHIHDNWYSIDYIMNQSNNFKTYLIKSSNHFMYVVHKIA